MKEMNLLKERFYVDKKTEPVWKQVRNHPIAKKYDLSPLDISMMATVVGYNKKLRVPGTFSYSSGGWIQNVQQGFVTSRQKNAISILIAIAVKEEGLDVLNKDVKEIQKIGEEYGNGGVHELLKIFNSESEEIVFNELFSLMRNSVK